MLLQLRPVQPQRRGEGDAARSPLPAPGAACSASLSRASVGHQPYRGWHLWSLTSIEPNTYRARAPAAEGWPLWSPTPIHPSPGHYRAPAMQSPKDQPLQCRKSHHIAECSPYRDLQLASKRIRPIELSL